MRCFEYGFKRDHLYYPVYSLLRKITHRINGTMFVSIAGGLLWILFDYKYHVFLITKYTSGYSLHVRQG